MLFFGFERVINIWMGLMSKLQTSLNRFSSQNEKRNNETKNFVFLDRSSWIFQKKLFSTAIPLQDFAGSLPPFRVLFQKVCGFSSLNFLYQNIHLAFWISFVERNHVNCAWKIFKYYRKVFFCMANLVGDLICHYHDGKELRYPPGQKFR